jgi:NSS family neurotransmitter:Na+ symporter
MASQMEQRRKSQHGQWSSRLAFILASTGAAVGLGNIWRFPYEAAANGGGAFVLTYICMVMLLGMPMLIAEMLLGRLGRANPVTSLKILAKENNASSAWGYLGWLSIVTLILVLSFYSVVAGWSIIYTLASISGKFNHISNVAVNNFWQQTISNPSKIIFYHAIFMTITIAVVLQGVSAGIEKANKIMMPLLFIFLISLVLYASQTDGFTAGWKFLLEFRYQELTLSTIVKALGQTCFTLAIGAGCMLVYGSYVEEKTNLAEAAFTISLINVGVAVLTGLAIFPLVFSYNMVPIGGPGLIFQVLPVAFANMQWGQFFASVFFTLILFAAWTSSISMAEPVVIMLIEKFSISRTIAAFITGILTWLIGIFSALSFNIWQHIHFIGKNNFFNTISELTTDIMLPLGILGFTIFAGWIIPTVDLRKSINCSSNVVFNIWHKITKYLAPVAIIIIILFNKS